EFGNYVSLRGIKGLAFTCLGSMSKWEPVTFQESLSFVKKVKARDYMLYISLLDVLNRNDQIPLQAYSELSLLFQHHEDLLNRDRLTSEFLFKQSFWIAVGRLDLFLTSR
ncbi:hypothetical protein ACJX0J_037039, partial [Zea mays]